VLYLWGYWQPFHINVLEYIGVADIVKAAVYPIASAFVFTVIGACLGQLGTDDLSPGGGADTKIGRFLRKWAAAIVGCYLILTTLLWLFGPPEKWFALPLLLTLPIVVAIRPLGLFFPEVRSEKARFVATFLLVALVPFAYGRGVLNANEVLAGGSYTYAASDIPGQSAPTGSNAQERPRYVGKTGDRYVFFDPVSRSVLSIAATELKALGLKRHDVPSSAEILLLPKSAGASPPRTSDH
jgi:hypothetical protein